MYKPFFFFFLCLEILGMQNDMIHYLASTCKWCIIYCMHLVYTDDNNLHSWYLAGPIVTCLNTFKVQYCMSYSHGRWWWIIHAIPWHLENTRQGMFLESLYDAIICVKNTTWLMLADITYINIYDITIPMNAYRCVIKHWLPNDYVRIRLIIWSLCLLKLIHDYDGTCFQI